MNKKNIVSLIAPFLIVGFIGCEPETNNYRDRDNWAKYELRVGKKFTDPYNCATVSEETTEMTKYLVRYNKFVTVKKGIIVSVWTKQN